MLLLAGCAAPAVEIAPPVRWRLSEHPAEGYPAGGAALAAGRMIALVPDGRRALLEIREERRWAEVGEEVRVHVRVDPRAVPSFYVVEASSNAALKGPARLTLVPGETGIFTVVSSVSGRAQVFIRLVEDDHVDRSAVPPK